MASHSAGPNPALPPSEWNSAAHVCNRNQMIAFMRAGLIALALLGILALIVLY